MWPGIYSLICLSAATLWYQQKRDEVTFIYKVDPSIKFCDFEDRMDQHLKLVTICLNPGTEKIIVIDKNLKFKSSNLSAEFVQPEKSNLKNFNLRKRTETIKCTSLNPKQASSEVNQVLGNSFKKVCTSCFIAIMNAVEARKIIANNRTISESIFTESDIQVFFNVKEEFYTAEYKNEFYLLGSLKNMKEDKFLGSNLILYRLHRDPKNRENFLFDVGLDDFLRLVNVTERISFKTFEGSRINLGNIKDEMLHFETVE